MFRFHYFLLFLTAREVSENNATGKDHCRSYILEAVSRLSASDDQLAVEEVLAGNISRFEEIVRRWQGPLINLAYRFCRDRGRAEEMAQEAFLRAYRALEQWRRDSAFSTWLLRWQRTCTGLSCGAFQLEFRRSKKQGRFVICALWMAGLKTRTAIARCEER